MVMLTTLKELEKAPSQRQKRVAETLKQAVASSLSAQGVASDILASSMLTVTQVKVSPDLKHALIFVVPLVKGIDFKVLQEELKVAGPDLQQAIRSHVVLKFMPKLKFKLDETMETLEEVNRLFHDPRVTQDLQDAS